MAPLPRAVLRTLSVRYKRVNFSKRCRPSNRGKYPFHQRSSGRYGRDVPMVNDGKGAGVWSARNRFVKLRMRRSGAGQRIFTLLVPWLLLALLRSHAAIVVVSLLHHQPCRRSTRLNAALVDSGLPDIIISVTTAVPTCPYAGHCHSPAKSPD